MLSRIAAIEPSTPTPVIVPADIPDVWVTDRIDLQDLARHQKEQFHDAYVEASQETDESPYIVQGSLLYTMAEPSHNAGRYLRLLLPQQFCQKVIDRCHAEVGHAAFLKTLSRVQEHYVWPEGDRLQAIRLAERILHEYRSKQKDAYRKQEPGRAKRLPPGTFVSGFEPTAKDNTCNLKKEVFLQDMPWHTFHEPVISKLQACDIWLHVNKNKRLSWRVAATHLTKVLSFFSVDDRYVSNACKAEKILRAQSRDPTHKEKLEALMSDEFDLLTLKPVLPSSKRKQTANIVIPAQVKENHNLLETSYQPVKLEFYYIKRLDKLQQELKDLKKLTKAARNELAFQENIKEETLEELRHLREDHSQPIETYTFVTGFTGFTGFTPNMQKAVYNAIQNKCLVDNAPEVVQTAKQLEKVPQARLAKWLASLVRWPTCKVCLCCQAILSSTNKRVGCNLYQGHTCQRGVTSHHPDVLQEFLRKYAKKLDGLTSSLLKDICNRSILSHPHLMVLFGFTDPWMTLFYQEKYSNLELVPHLKSSVEFLESLTRDPSHLLHTVTDCFGQILDEQDPVLTSLKASPLNAGSTGRVAQVALLVLQCQLHDYINDNQRQMRNSVKQRQATTCSQNESSA
ncbi:hypothetical protein CAPTEDRAFT_226532 [Capitella teleta]|uniref:Integrase zinc-binding domain-containing protein n=1 Tax=Capitella teleta TaxID=283909 RepID=R7VD31_CAPTE|nr:hypothetical protein CAPTEDRAFT_226532 [Capitella teleta]|eukprot:ELU14186.1 hypothetical protein CAPTEDRAFT_226532 [Capitella teleta]